MADHDEDETHHHQRPPKPWRKNEPLTTKRRSSITSSPSSSSSSSSSSLPSLNPLAVSNAAIVGHQYVSSLSLTSSSTSQSHRPYVASTGSSTSVAAIS
ncbi:unnamed protein product [Brassica oleracea]